MATLNLGYCGICEHEIWTIVNNRPTPNKHYAEFWMSFDDETIAKHAICDGDYNALTDEKVVEVFERIRETWLEELVGLDNKAEVKRVEKKTVLTWGLSEDAVYENIIDYSMLSIKDKVKKPKKKES